MDENRAANIVKRYSGFDDRCKRVIRVFADRPYDALAKAKEHLRAMWCGGISPVEVVRCVVEDPMEQITRGD